MPIDRQNMTMQELLDLLAQKTQVLTHLLAEKNFGHEYEECKQTIKELQAEIDQRKEAEIK